MKLLSSLPAVFSLIVFLTGCGSSSNSSSVSDVSIRFSDAPVDEVSEVVIEVDQIIFSRDGEEDIVVDTFTSAELGIEDADTFTIDLLEVQGNDNRLVLDSVLLPIGDYQNLKLVILDEDTGNSYVLKDGIHRELKVPSDKLKLGAFEVSDKSAQTFVIEFGLRQAMTYNPVPDRYILKPRGVRIVRLENASSISGTVDLAEMHILDSCSDKPNSTVGNVAYLYAGHGLDSSLLGDVFVRQDDSEEVVEFDEDVPENIIAPTVATSIDGDGNYLFSYLFPGNYTLAISCQAEEDSPVYYDEIPVPAPAGKLIELSLPAETDLDCDFAEEVGCSVAE